MNKVGYRLTIQEIGRYKSCKIDKDTLRYFNHKDNTVLMSTFKIINNEKNGNPIKKVDDFLAIEWVKNNTHFDLVEIDDFIREVNYTVKKILKNNLYYQLAKYLFS